MVARQVVDREQRAEDREQVEVEACSPSKRGRRAGSAGHHVTGGRAGGRGEARQSPRASRGGRAPLPAGRRAHLKSLAG